MNLATLKDSALRNRVPLIIFLVSFFFYAYIAYCAPFTSDDYEFSSYSFSFKELLDYVLYYGNGRFLGNLGTLLIIKNRFLQILIKSTMMASMIVLIPRFLSTNSSISYICSFLLFIGISPRVFAQVFTWTSGFNNYITPVFLTVVIANLYKDSFCNVRKNNLALSVIVFLLGLSSQLFSEHTTIVNICIAFTALAYSTSKRVSNISIPVAWLLAALIGAAIMYALPKVFYIPGNLSEGYREIRIDSISILFRTVVHNFSELYKMMISNVPAVILLVAIALCTAHYTKILQKMKLVLFVLCVGASLSYFFSKGFWEGDYNFIQQMIEIFLVMFVILASLWVIFKASQHNERFNIALLSILFFFSLAPLLIVDPIGERCVFLAYTFLTGIILIGVNNMPSIVSVDWTCMFKKYSCMVSAILCALIIFLYSYINQLNTILQRHIESEIATGANTIYVFNTPYNYTFGCLDIHFERHYYNYEWGDIDFVMLSMDEWMSLYGKDD